MSVFPLVRSLEDVRANVQEYQKAVRHALSAGFTKPNPNGVRAWYYFPDSDLIGASRFVGYESMTFDRYQQDHGNGRETERHLRQNGWFRLLTGSDPLYAQARQAIMNLGGSVRQGARFNVPR